nr:hypothetical protein [uncultured bacterium]
MNHHGTPFSIGMIWVSPPISDSSEDAICGSAGAFTARTTTSCVPSADGSAEAFTATQRVSPPSVSSSPSLSIARRVAPRATTETSLPASASLAAIQPPIAPAPTTQMFMDAPMRQRSPTGK